MINMSSDDGFASAEFLERLDKVSCYPRANPANDSYKSAKTMVHAARQS